MSRAVSLVFGLQLLGSVLSTQGCGSPAAETSQAPESAAGAEQAKDQVSAAEATPTTANSAKPMPAVELGGRLFDDWAAELGVEFVPDNPSTPALDGKGGPFGNGTLADAKGAPMVNAGHNYRLKNLFGWDLRGGDGIYGERFLNKTHVLLPDLLKNTESRETWTARLTKGEDAIPAYGQVLSPEQIDALVTFLLSVRDGTLPQPADIFVLTSKEQGNYSLVAGADVARGHEVFARTCAHCHGADGAKWPIEDGKYSVGSIARQKAYETWLKVLNGQPGTDMHAQIEHSLTGEQKAAVLRDLLAALCDSTRYPKGPGSVPEVGESDARCGSYLH